MATVIERVANALSRQPQGVPLGDLARQLGLSYQGVRNEIERCGLQHGIWIDRSYSPALVRLRASAERPASADSALAQKATPSTPDISREPDWEGNVQARVCGWLIEDGWDLEQVADTSRRHQHPRTRHRHRRAPPGPASPYRGQGLAISHLRRPRPPRHGQANRAHESSTALVRRRNAELSPSARCAP